MNRLRSKSRMMELKSWAREIRREAHALYIAAQHRRTPWYAKALAIAIAAYALSPLDLVPDFIPVLGFIDEVLLLPIAIAGVLRLVPSDVMDESRAIAVKAAERPVSRGAAVVIALIWIAAIAGSAWATYRWYHG